LYSHEKHEKTQRVRIACGASPSFAIAVLCGFSCFLWLTILPAYGDDSKPGKPESLAEITGRLAKETSAAYDECRFSALSKNYFNRFSRNPSAAAHEGETTIDSHWHLILPENVAPLGPLMATQLQMFLRDRMGV
jgi:hypothetical protein